MICWFSLAAAAAPPAAWFGRSSAMILAPPGAIRMDVSWDGAGGAVSVTTTLMPRIEVSVSSSSAVRFGLETRLVLVEDLVPFLFAATVSTKGVGVIATLFFGQVRIDAGRMWGRDASRWGTAQLSARPELSMLFGVDERDGRVEPFVGARIFPGGHALWEIDLTIGRTGLRVSLSAVAW